MQRYDVWFSGLQSTVIRVMDVFMRDIREVQGEVFSRTLRGLDGITGRMVISLPPGRKITELSVNADLMRSEDVDVRLVVARVMPRRSLFDRKLAA